MRRPALLILGRGTRQGCCLAFIMVEGNGLLWDMSIQLLLQHLGGLRADKLHSSMEILGGFLMTAFKNNKDAFTPANHYEILVTYAIGKLKDKQYKAAEAAFKEALIVRKSGLKQKGMAPSFAKLPSEAYIKYKLYLCYQGMDNIPFAVSVLESLPVKVRPVKVNLILGKLYQRLGLTRSAVTCYKEVLKKNPLAFDAIFNLLSLGDYGSEVTSIISNAIPGSDWILNLVKGHAMMHNKDYQRGFALLEAASQTSTIAGDVQLERHLAQLRVRTGDNRSAISHFERARTRDPYLLDGMDVYAFLLHEEKELGKLDKLATDLFYITESHPATWVALGYRALSRHEFKKAIYLAVQATKLNQLCLTAVVLKGCALRAIDEQSDAIAHFKEASRLEPTRFVCYKELVDTYLSMMRQTDAMVAAQSALKTIGAQPNCLVLCAKVQMNAENAKEKAKTYVDKALAIEPNNQYAMLVKGEILLKCKKLEEAVKFLCKCVENHSNSQMHSLLGNCYHELGNYAKAMNHHTVALSLDPENKMAEDGITAMSNLHNDLAFEDMGVTDLSGQLGGGGTSDDDMVLAD